MDELVSVDTLNTTAVRTHLEEYDREARRGC